MKGRVKAWALWDRLKLAMLDFVVCSMRAKGYVTSIELAEAVGVTIERAREFLWRLRDLGLIHEAGYVGGRGERAVEA